jgi:hypothetical protein
MILICRGINPMGNLQRPLFKSAMLADCDDKVMTVAVQMYV